MIKPYDQQSGTTSQGLAPDEGNTTKVQPQDLVHLTRDFSLALRQFFSFIPGTAKKPGRWILKDNITSIVTSKQISYRFDLLAKILEHSILRYKNFLDTEPTIYNGAKLTPLVIQLALQIAFMRTINFEKEGLSYITPNAPSEYTLNANGYIPFMSRLATGYIRKNPIKNNNYQNYQPTYVAQVIGAIPLAPGAVRDLVFKSVQRDNPQMDPSSRINNTYIVAELHRVTLETIYIDTFSEVNALLAIDKMPEKFPSLQRIVMPMALLETLAQNINFELMRNPNYFSQNLTLVVTDPLNAQAIDRLNTILTDNKYFAKSFTGIGFSSGELQNNINLDNFLKEHRIKSIELNPRLIQPTFVSAASRLKIKLVINPVDLINDYYHDLPYLEPEGAQGCLSFDEEMLSLGRSLLKSTMQLIVNGKIEVEWTPRGKSVLGLLYPHLQ